MVAGDLMKMESTAAGLDRQGGGGQICWKLWQDLMKTEAKVLGGGAQWRRV